MGPSRRDLLLAALPAPLSGALVVALPAAAQAQPAVLERTIPSSGERIAAVGLGTWLTFDLPIGDAEGLARRRAVLDRFFAGGGRLVDSSPMYGYAEAVLGELLARPEPRLFSATKVWTGIAGYGPTQMRRSLGLWRLPRVDLMQVHNLLAWREHLSTLRAWKDEGRIRHLGVTTSHGRAHDEVERILRGERIDFLQITYSPVDRSAEPLLGLAAERGVAVIVNRPFDGGALLQRLARRPLPALARELGCDSWAALVLKWELAHPAVTCAIPATTNPLHVTQNLQALRGPLPDRRQREALLRAFA
ncbi:MAG: aldo/keto reductase [Pseudomonadota bacterium]|jgi:diketogulonate reductase-like aldo/keto reductase|nr:aldo/keto reductase [Burkholderiales bacterium]MCA3251639.1 aldo/keto reductase [Rubrivivax sp.]MCA3258129.1 aldo/keto reductase [Rubrivivax sp.]MCE2912289.1 aldo/keto reductase [Rubrivivax sp.]MCZ8031448.1 aldo/keto reductase [Rubrivivax sp.]